MGWIGCMPTAPPLPKEVHWTGGSHLEMLPSRFLKNFTIQCKTGKEAQNPLIPILKPDYREKLEAELKELRESEMWQAGAVVRKLRPENN
jgi:hypothetical protein